MVGDYGLEACHEVGAARHEQEQHNGVRLLSDPQNFRIFMVVPTAPAYFEIPALQCDSAHVISARVGTAV
jgi:hypothetical protein